MDAQPQTSYALILQYNDNKVSIQPARDFWPLESHHFVSALRYPIQFLSLRSFVDCGFRVRVSSTVRVSVGFIFCHFSFPMQIIGRKLPAGRLPPWLSGSVFSTA